jgi:hypothetical protein
MSMERPPSFAEQVESISDIKELLRLVDLVSDEESMTEEERRSYQDETTSSQTRNEITKKVKTRVDSLLLKLELLSQRLHRLLPTVDALVSASEGLSADESKRLIHWWTYSTGAK